MTEDLLDNIFTLWISMLDEKFFSSPTTHQVINDNAVSQESLENLKYYHDSDSLKTDGVI